MLDFIDAFLPSKAHRPIPIVQGSPRKAIKEKIGFDSHRFEPIDHVLDDLLANDRFFTN